MDINGEIIKDDVARGRRRVARQCTTRVIVVVIATEEVFQSNGQSAQGKTGPNRFQETYNIFPDTTWECARTFVNVGAGLLSALPDRSRKSGGCCGDSKCEDSEGLVRVHVRG